MLGCNDDEGCGNKGLLVEFIKIIGHSAPLAQYSYYSAEDLKKLKSFLQLEKTHQKVNVATLVPI